MQKISFRDVYSVNLVSVHIIIRFSLQTFIEHILVRVGGRLCKMKLRLTLSSSTEAGIGRQDNIHVIGVQG